MGSREVETTRVPKSVVGALAGTSRHFADEDTTHLTSDGMVVEAAFQFRRTSIPALTSFWS